MDKSRVEPTIFFIEKISFSLKIFFGHFYGQSFIKTVRGPFNFSKKILTKHLFCLVDLILYAPVNIFSVDMSGRACLGLNITICRD